MRGLTSAEAARRLAANGPNDIGRTGGRSAFSILRAQVSSPVVWLLLAACALSATLSEWADAVAIAAIVILDALVGFFQEYRAERALLALRSMTAPRANPGPDLPLLATEVARDLLA